jgi:hypothetical protein
MVINDLNIKGISIFPGEAYSPLVVNADAVLSGTVASQRLESVAGRYPQILQGPGAMEI